MPGIMKNKKLLSSVCFLFVFICALGAQNVTVKGNVTSKTDGQPVIGASVIETSSSANGTISDFDGNFSLTVPANATLKITYIGYKPITVKAAASVRVQLEEDTQMMEEVVVTGYTTQRKADLTGAVSVVNIEELQKKGENNPVKALQGRVPGMNITADGNPSGTATVRIRGIGTLNNNDPLYIIDGVPTKAGMHELNGNDIESIQVLKDAASASIYGSRAANGVIIITTKKGKEGSIKVNFDASVTASMYHTKQEMMNTDQYGRTLWQAYTNEGINPNSNPIGYRYDWGYDAGGYPTLNQMLVPKYIDSENKIPTADTDWFDEITRTGFIQQYNVSVTNGTERGTYFFSLGYYKNDGLIKYSNFDRISARMNSEYKLIGDMLTIGENFTLNRTTEVQAPANVLSDAMISLPMIPVHTTDGGWGGPNKTMPDRQNIARVNYDNKDNRYTYWRIFGDAHVNFNPFKNFNVRSTFGLDYAQKLKRSFTIPYENGTLSNSTSAVNMVQEHWTRWMWNAIATYNFEIKKHRADFMIGTELNREDDVAFGAYREGFAVISPDYMYPDAGTGISKATGGAGGFTLASFFGKANYAYADRYLASLTIRRDGSSRFGQNNKWGTFPSVSVGWRISEEAFMQRTRNVIDDLKIRAAWGQTGNQEIENTARYSIYEANYGTGNSPTYGTSYDITGSNGGALLPSGFKRNQLMNENLKWETTTQTNIGVDFSLFNQSLYGSAEYFYKKTKDILIKPSYIAVIGEGGGQWRNVGEMENKGFELNLGYRNKTAFGLTYDVNANVSFYRNEILFVPEDVASTGDFGGDGVMNIIGHAINMRAGYVADGLFRTQEEVDAYNAAYDVKMGQPGLGRIRYRDVNNDGVIDTKDQDWIGNPNPKFTYGLNINLGYKNFDLSMFWQGVQGVDVVNDVKKNTDFWSLGDMNANRGTRLLGAWSPSNPQSNIPAVSVSDLNNEARFSTYFVENGSYLKLRMLQLGYTLPETLTQKIRMSNLRFYVSGDNLLTIKSKKFTSMDPENPNFGYPIPINLTFGFNVSF